MEQASAWRCCMVPQVATLATLVGISHSSAKRCKRNQKPQVTTARGSENHKKKKPRSNHSEGTTVDFSTFWWIKDLPHLEVSSQ